MTEEKQAEPGAAQSRPRILVVDDERNIRRTLSLALGGEGYGVVEAADGREALERAAEGNCRLVLLDLKMPRMSGMETLERLRVDWPHIPVIVISGQATVTDAVQATRMGAHDFIEKPLEKERVLLSVRLALESSRLRIENEQMRTRLELDLRMVGRSAVIERLREEIRRAAPSRSRILIMGESGTGKELVARQVHELGPCSKGPFIKVNCAAIPSELIESELFGAERGAFTGADRLKVGKFEQAHGGTLFLDEIGDMSLEAQAKVLRVLQTGEVNRLGGDRTIRVEARVVAATNKNLEEEIARRTFREDLFYRLNVIPLVVPPLRQRKDDIPELASCFVELFCRSNGFRLMEIEDDALTRLGEHNWPGNVRELRNVMERLVIMVRKERIRATDVEQHLTGLIAGSSPTAAAARALSALLGQKTLRQFREEQERNFILAALEETGWNVSRAASILGLERTNLHKKISTYNLKR